MSNDTTFEDIGLIPKDEPSKIFGFPRQNFYVILAFFFFSMISSGIFLFFKILEERGIKYDADSNDGEPDSWIKRIKWIINQLLSAVTGSEPPKPKLDEIDEAFIKAVEKLPDKGYFIKEGKVNFDTFLMLYKEIYTHARAKEVDNYNKLLEKRKKFVEDNHEQVVTKEYVKLVIGHMRIDNMLMINSQQLAAE